MTAKTGKEKGKSAKVRGVIITSNGAEWLMTYQLTAIKSNMEEVRVKGCVEGYLHIWVYWANNKHTGKDILGALHLPSA